VQAERVKLDQQHLVERRGNHLNPSFPAAAASSRNMEVAAAAEAASGLVCEVSELPDKCVEVSGVA
jgi:hypothetical protein